MMNTTAQIVRATKISLVMLAGAFCSLTGIAATAPPDTGDAAGGEAIEDIVVTARRVSERSQDVPVAVTPLNAAALGRASIFEPSDLQFHVPSLTVAGDILGGDAVPIFAIRGLAQELYTEPTVVTYFSDVPADSRFIGNALFDLADVQVVRGPQGTLFGKNAVGGAVLFEPARPTDQLDGFIQARYGNYDSKEVTAVINTPLAEGIDFRLAGNLVRQDGLVKNLDGPAENNKRRDSLRASLLIHPNDQFEDLLVAQYYHLEQNGSAGILSGVAPCPPSKYACIYTPRAEGGLGLGDLPAVFAQQQALGARTIDNPYPNRDDIRDSRLANTTTVHLGDITVKNILGFNYSEYFTSKDIDGSSIPFFSNVTGQTTRNGSEELQVQGRSFNSLKWIVGGFYSDSNVHDDNVNNVFVGASPTNPSTAFDVDTSKSTAIFAQATQDLSMLLPGLEFTGGYRYTWDKRDETLRKLGRATQVCALSYPAGTPLAGQYFPNVDTTCTRRENVSFDAAGYTYGFNYKIVDGVMVYVSRNRAYKAGGLSESAVDPGLVSYQPEYVVDTELGLKADWHLAGRPIRTNLSLYKMDFTNIQLEDTNLYDGIAESVIINGSSATLKGAELEVTYRVLEGVTLDASFTVAKGTYGSLLSIATGNIVDVGSGRRFADVPSNTGRYGVTWDVPVPSTWGSPALSVNYYRQSAMPGLVTRPDTDLNNVPAYGVGNARLDIHGVAGSPVDFALYVNNFTNKLYSTSALDDTLLLGFATRNYGDPRLYGAQVTYRFGASASR